MDKLKNMLAPGHAKDTEILYDTPQSKGHNKTTTESVGAPAVQPSSTTVPTEERFDHQPSVGTYGTDGTATTAPTTGQQVYSNDHATTGHHGAAATTTTAPLEERRVAEREFGSDVGPSYTGNQVDQHDSRHTGGAVKPIAAGAGVAAAEHEHHHHHNNLEERHVSEGMSTDQKLHTQPRKEHNIIRSVLNPNNEKHDSTLYGTTASSTAPPQTETAPKQKEHGVLRQLINPNDDRVDSVRKSSVGGAPIAEVLPIVNPEHKLQTHPEAKKKEHGILRQILNPHDDKVDSVRFGNTARVHAPEAAASDRQAL